MGVGTNVRAGRTWRTLVAAQLAKGTAIENFNGAAQTWNVEAKQDGYGDQIAAEWWMSYPTGYYVQARYNAGELTKGVILARATPTLTSLTLQSLYGSLAGSTFTLTGYVNTWLSIAFVEDKTLTNTATRVVRLSDALVHQLSVNVDSQGFVDLALGVAAEVVEDTTLSDLDALDLILPIAPMNLVDTDVFAGRVATLTRDPAGSATDIPFERMTIKLDENLEEQWDQCGQVTRAIRRGPLSASIVVTGKPADEHWQMALDSYNGVPRTYRAQMTAGAHVLTFTFSNVTFNVDSFGLNDQTFDPMTSTGVATLDGSGNFVSVTLT